MSEQFPVDVSILVVSHNTRELTEAAIAAVARETRGLRFEIIAADNASTDGSPEMLRTHPAKPQVIELDTNIGFARANNLAAKYARGRYILLVNPDTVILDNAVGRLLDFARATPGARIWGGRTLFSDGHVNPSSCWHRMTSWTLFCRASGLAAIFPKSKLFNAEAYGGWNRDSVRRVDIVSGCFLLIERSLWKTLGGFDPHFFMYGEEADLCLRAHAFGASPMITPDATIIHYGGASERARGEKLVRLLAAKASLITRHWHPANVSLGHALNAAWPLSRLIATSLVAIVVRDRHRRETADTWREVWRRRRSWLRGYRAIPDDPVLPRILVPSVR